MNLESDFGENRKSVFGKGKVERVLLNWRGEDCEKGVPIIYACCET